MTAVQGRTVAAAVIGMGIVAGLLWHFHDRFWWPVDEGVYAYVAQRLLAGDRLHVDLIDLHGGYGNMINALAFVLFGEDLLSLRYPLIIATLGQCLIVFLLLAPKGRIAAVAGAMGVGAFSLVQFLNPSANWYALALFFATTMLLDRCDPRQARTLLLAGFLIGLCFFVRQLSGVILAMGTLSWLLLRLSRPGRADRAITVPLTLVMGLGLSGYLWSKASIVALGWSGIWPLGLLAIVAVRARVPLRDGARLIGLLSLGVCLAALPLAIHHAWEGALTAWLRDVFLTALLINRQSFIELASFGTVFRLALATIVTSGDPVAALNGFGWIVVLSLSPLVGALTLRAAIRNQDTVAPLPLMAVFWSLIAIHYQIPIYLYFALPATIAALLWLCPYRTTAVGVIVLAIQAVVFHAGQPVSRGLAGTVAGQRVSLDATEGLPRASLRMEATDHAVFTAVLERIEAVARPDEPLMTLPMDPELNFMTGRPAPVPYYGTPLGLRTDADVADSVARLSAAAPLFVVHRREDKYLTPLSAELLAWIRAVSPRPERIGPFDLYRLSSAAAERPADPPE